jgi:hypothetical protein
VNPRDLSPGRAEILIAVAAFAVLCVVALSVRTLFLEPDDNAYQASIIAMTQGRFLTLSTQVHALVAQLARSDRQLFAGSAGGPPAWFELSGGRWISEKDPVSDADGGWRVQDHPLARCQRGSVTARTAESRRDPAPR